MAQWLFPRGHHPRKVIFLQFIPVAKLQIWNSNKIILWLEVTKTWGTVLKSYSIRKVEHHWNGGISSHCVQEETSWINSSSNFCFLTKHILCIFIHIFWLLSSLTLHSVPPFLLYKPTNTIFLFMYFVCFEILSIYPRAPVWPWVWNSPLEPGGFTSGYSAVVSDSPIPLLYQQPLVQWEKMLTSLWNPCPSTGCLLTDQFSCRLDASKHSCIRVMNWVAESFPENIIPCPFPPLPSGS